MIEFTTVLLQFAEQGEKTGWTYIRISSKLAQKLKPGNKKSFRVKGKLDNFAIKAVALLPMGEGDFIMAVNATMRKGIGKRKGAMVKVQIQEDKKELQVSKEFLECLSDEPKAVEYFKTLARSHQLYFSKWIEAAKTVPTRTKRIAQAVTALAKGFGFSEMIRSLKQKKKDLNQ
jgi:hypothetical protein